MPKMSPVGVKCTLDSTEEVITSLPVDHELYIEEGYQR